ncbi:hypothetical protein [Hyphobacterium indicum]|uniref:hypothetical protein n=1 Tax=Hyphobacterium indicum TaxID=2162714 RepID=UPI000F6315BB|nr:hypothetical protein [Hyphobacterium indicum]
MLIAGTAGCSDAQGPQIRLGDSDVVSCYKYGILEPSGDLIGSCIPRLSTGLTNIFIRFDDNGEFVGRVDIDHPVREFVSPPNTNLSMLTLGERVFVFHGPGVSAGDPGSEIDMIALEETSRRETVENFSIDPVTGYRVERTRHDGAIRVNVYDADGASVARVSNVPDLSGRYGAIMNSYQGGVLYSFAPHYDDDHNPYVRVLADAEEIAFIQLSDQRSRIEQASILPDGRIVLIERAHWITEEMLDGMLLNRSHFENRLHLIDWRVASATAMPIILTHDDIHVASGRRLTLQGMQENRLVLNEGGTLHLVDPASATQSMIFETGCNAPSQSLLFRDTTDDVICIDWPEQSQRFLPVRITRRPLESFQ